MKKSSFFLVLIFSFIVAFSCSDSKSEKANSLLVGTWAERPSREQFVFTFNEDGTGIHEVFDNRDNSFSPPSTFTYTLDLEMMILILHYDDEDDPEYPYKIKVSNNTLIIAHDHDDCDETFYLFRQ